MNAVFFEVLVERFCRIFGIACVYSYTGLLATVYRGAIEGSKSVFLSPCKSPSKYEEGA